MAFKTTVKDPVEFIRLARERYRQAREADSIDRKEAEDDVRFAAGGDGQWYPEALQMRRDPKNPRPVVTWNLLTEPINQVCNDGRQMHPSIKATPMDGGTKETAEFFQGRARHIEYESDADISYDTSREQAVISGRGFYRVRTEYKSYKSCEQRIVIEPIDNQFSVLWDASAKKWDKSDADFWFLVSRISKDEFKRKRGEDVLDRFVKFESEDAIWAQDWLGTDQLVPEVEYWVREYGPEETLYELTTGKTFLASELEKNGLEVDGKGLRDLNSKQPVEVRRKRQTRVPKVMQYVINGVEILEEHEWLGTIIPFIPYWGRRMSIDGRMRTFSLIRDAKDPQRSVNLTAANIAELTANVPKTKWAVAEGQLAGHEKEWQPGSNVLYKQYKTHDAQNRPLPAPVPDAAEPPIMALTGHLGQAIDAVKKTTAIFGASLGDRSNETSGRAINARKIESDVANFHFLDNEARSRKLLGRILLELIPLIDQGQKQVPIRHPDGKTELIWINRETKDSKTGKPIQIKPSEGDYDVAISTGPTYTSQRQEAAANLLDFAKIDKNLLGVAGDVVYGTQDGPGMDIVADRYKEAVIPPQFRQKDGEAPQIPPQVQAQLQQAGMMIEALSKKLNEATELLKSRMDVVSLQEETKRMLAIAKLNSQEGLTLLEHRVNAIQSALDMQLEHRKQDLAEFQSASDLIQQQAQGGNGGQPAAPDNAPEAAPAGAEATQ